jgi:hypothetical protein
MAATITAVAMSISRTIVSPKAPSGAAGAVLAAMGPPDPGKMNTAGLRPARPKSSKNKDQPAANRKKLRTRR